MAVRRVAKILEVSVSKNAGCQSKKKGMFEKLSDIFGTEHPKSQKNLKNGLMRKRTQEQWLRSR